MPAEEGYAASIANIGGALTPLGDRPLFRGYLRGVDFFWTTEHMLPEMVFASLILLALFWFFDRQRHQDFRGVSDPTPDTPKFGICGKTNWAFLLAVIGAVLMSGSWKPAISISIRSTLGIAEYRPRSHFDFSCGRFPHLLSGGANRLRLDVTASIMLFLDCW